MCNNAECVRYVCVCVCTDLPQGETAAYELVIWLVVMEASTSPFRSQMMMLVSTDAVIINFPLTQTTAESFLHLLLFLFYLTLTVSF